MKKIIFVFPRIHNSLNEIHYPPFGLVEIVSYLKQSNENVLIFDRNLEKNGKDKLYSLLNTGNFDILAISSMFIQKDDATQILKWAQKHFNGEIALGGEFFTINKELYLNHADYIVCGDGELFFSQLQMTDLKHGIYFPEGIRKLDCIPIPDKNLLDSVAWDKNVFSLKTSRGCPFKCIFCSYLNNNSKNIRAYSPEYIISYMNFIYENYGISRFRLMDDVFTLDKERVKNFCKMLRNSKYPFTIEECFSHVSINDSFMFREMYESGFKTIQIGIESLDDSVLKIIGKNITRAEIQHTIYSIYNSGLKAEGLYMIGNIGDTYKSIDNTIKLAETLPTYKDWFSFACPLPNTNFYNLAHNYGTIIEKDLNKYTNKSVVFVPDGMTKEELEFLMDQAHKMVIRKIRKNIKERLI